MRAYEDIPQICSAHVATQSSHYLAEGPTWDPTRECVWWVDIMAGTVNAGRLDGEQLVPIEQFEVPDTAGTVAVGTTGELLIAGTHHLYYRDNAGVLHAGRELVSGHSRRFNDGKPDPLGRFIVGTAGPSEREQLLQLGERGNVTVVDNDLTLANGLAFNRAGDLLYTIDTLRQQIFVRRYDAQRGSFGRRHRFITFDVGLPDGCTTDADDHLWVAMWGEGVVLRISPQATVVGRIPLPAPHVSCPAFVGPELDTMVITTATKELGEAELREFPQAGHLFVAKPGVSGNPPHMWDPLLLADHF